MNISMRLNQRVTDLIQAAGKTLGMQITRSDNSLEAKRQRVLETLSIDMLLDVGANIGNYALEVRRNGFRAKIISFEPIFEVFELLRQTSSGDSQWICHHLALGEKDAESEINVSRNFASSSLLTVTNLSTEAEQGTAITRREKIRIARLDSLRSSLMAPSDRIYMKVDVQGFEKQVLAGATETLTQIEAIEIELTLVELYSKQTLMAEMLSLLDALGFLPVWLERGFKDPRTGHLLQMDGIFIRRQR